jgi:VanZ family protein
LPHVLSMIVVTVLASTRRLSAFMTVSCCDKIGHFLFWGGLSFFAIHFFYRTRWYWTVMMIGLVAAAEECSQKLFSSRSFELNDLLANIAGIVLLGIASALFRSIRASRGIGSYSTVVMRPRKKAASRAAIAPSPTAAAREGERGFRRSPATNTPGADVRM